MNEKKIYRILEMCLWVVVPFMLFLAFFNHEIQPGRFLQWLGKMHPLALHFPIVFGMLISVYFLFIQQRRLPPNTEKLLLAINALFAGVVAVFGLLLASENAYDGQLISLHKWGGVAIAVMSWLFLYLVQQKTIFKKIGATVFLIVLIGATHKGAQLTHGLNALSFPKPSTPKTITIDSTSSLYQAAIAPVFQQKCVSCHGPDKMKGDLQLNTPANILKGGKDGNILTVSANNDAILLEKIHLPLTHDDHMPPEGKTQLTSEEIDLLNKWIRSGADFKMKLNDLPKDDSLYLLAKAVIPEPEQTELPQKDLPDLDEYNTNYCTVNYLFNGSDKVEVNFFQGSFYDRESLKKLGKIKENIVHLDMQGMPLKKEDLDLILQFSNLEKLNLNYTGLDIQLLESLKSLPNLGNLSISGIKCDERSLGEFLKDAKLTELTVWSDNVNENQLATLISKYPNIDIVVGDNLADEIIKINNPVIKQDSSVMADHLDVAIKHLLKDVDIRYTTDGSDPDSLKSNKYAQPIRLSNNTVLKVKAFKTGWLSSDIVQRTFYKSEIRPDTVFLVTNPDKKYSGNGAATLVDLELGGSNSSNGKWLGYKDDDMEFVVGFKEKQTLKAAHFNALVNTGSYIFPIQSISVQGSNDGKSYQRITEVSFPAAEKTASSGANSYNCNFPESTSYSYYKFIVTNLKKLPAWHPGKGKSAWIFVDEIFLD